MRTLLLSSLLFIASACGSNNGGPPDGAILDFGPGGCSLAGSDPTCGKACTGDTDCADTLFCSNGKCAAVCTAQAPCPSGYLCAKGQCLAKAVDPGKCTNLSCLQVTCSNGGSTTLTGKVFAPNGTLPLYNAIVYVPNAPLAALPEGVSCDVCGAVQSGQPVTATITGTDGSFVLSNVPVSNDLPLVVQMGKWRKEVKIPKITACTAAAVDVGLTTLPKTAAQGNMPKMAIATGNADPFECLLRKIGIADSEITLPTANGRVHYYRLNGKDMSPSAPAANAAGMTGLYSELTKLKQYDVVMLPCEGNPNLDTKNVTQLKNIVDYTTAGGRIFATHYSYAWLQKLTNNEPAPPFPGIANWSLDENNPPEPFFGTLNTSFPKGMAFSQWMGNVGALVSMGANAGKLDIKDPRHDLTTVIDPPAKRWIYSDTGSQVKIDQHFTFNTPLSGAALDDAGMPIQCGRVVFSDFHVSADALTGMNTFPASCKVQELSPQEKALAFMLFDLSSCVQDDDAPVGPPIF
jgi:hypothetical protein